MTTNDPTLAARAAELLERNEAEHVPDCLSRDIECAACDFESEGIYLAIPLIRALLTERERMVEALREIIADQRRRNPKELPLCEQIARRVLDGPGWLEKWRSALPREEGHP